MSGTSQNTLAHEVSLVGIGVHSGEESRLVLKPAESNSGIRFVRTDLDDSVEIPASLDHVKGTELGTTLGIGDTVVMTVEHVLAALAGRQVDNVVVELDGPEPPILDGSFKDYIHAIDSVGLQKQDADAKVIPVSDTLEVATGKGASYVAVADEDFRISATIDFEHEAIGRQFGAFGISEEFAGELAPARTFGFRADAEALQARGLARGSSLENTVVLDDDGVMNDDLRFSDEFLRHKVGDIVGDLALMGGRPQGHIVAHRPSHAGNVALARAIKEQADRAALAHRVDVHRIMEYLPHRYPMLLVDRIIEFEPGKRIVGIKNVTINEPFFQGHFPNHPIMPGVFIVEAMGQVGGLLLMDTVENPEGKVVYFMSLDNVKWRRPVIPGDQIVFELEMLQFRRHVCKMRGTGKVDGKVVAEAELKAQIVDR